MGIPWVFVGIRGCDLETDTFAALHAPLELWQFDNVRYQKFFLRHS